jgi:hypothetical protein
MCPRCGPWDVRPCHACGFPSQSAHTDLVSLLTVVDLASKTDTFLSPLHSLVLLFLRERAKAAILALKERSGSSLPALKKFLKLDPSQWRFLNAALKAGVASGFFVKNKGKFKLSAEAKKPPKKKKKPKKKKPKKKKKKKKKKKPKKKKKAKKKKAKKSSKKKSSKKKSKKKKSDKKKKSKKKSKKKK